MTLSSDLLKSGLQPTVSKFHKPGMERGEERGIWTVVDHVWTRDKDSSGSSLLYRVRCMRCDKESFLKSNAIRKDSKYCAHCRDLKEVLGRLMSYDAIESLYLIKKATIMQRMSGQGMSLEDAIFKPLGGMPREVRAGLIPLTVCGQTKTLKEWAEFSGISVRRLSTRTLDKVFSDDELVEMGLKKKVEKTRKEDQRLEEFFQSLDLPPVPWSCFSFKAGVYDEGSMVVGWDPTGRYQGSLRNYGSFMSGASHCSKGVQDTVLELYHHSKEEQAFVWVLAVRHMVNKKGGAGRGDSIQKLHELAGYAFRRLGGRVSWHHCSESLLEFDMIRSLGDVYAYALSDWIRTVVLANIGSGGFFVAHGI